MLVIIDYGVGNLGSIHNMLRKNGVQAVVSGDPEQLSAATRLILPGVGAFDYCMSRLNDSGLLPVIEQKAKQEKVPVLGICVGLQMLSQKSEEGKLPGLGWIDAETVRFDASRLSPGTKVPHMGWTDVEAAKPVRLLQDMPVPPRFYFVHSYYVRCNRPEDEAMRAHYGYPFTAGIEKDNLCGVQFHPEKSHKFGLQLLRNFAERY